jgi:2-oxoisovalerate dehydrogenase E2 component (dihydrolipoyl transacylase)
MGVTPVKMPQLGESVTEGTVDRWLKHEGDYVRRDEPLVEVVTDKVNAEVPSPFEGTLRTIDIQEGTTVPIGATIAQMEVEGLGIPSTPVVERPRPQPARAEPVPAPSREGVATATVASGVAPEAGAAQNGPRPRWSPAVRRLAEEHDLDLTRIAGSGHNGRVTRDDVLAVIAASTGSATSAPPPAPVPAPPEPAVAREPAAVREPGEREELLRHNTMRRSIAQRMVHSVVTAPQAWTVVEVDMTAIVRYRQSQRASFRERHGVSLTYLPFVVQALSESLQSNPLLNAEWTDDAVLVKHYLNLGIAVAIEGGLIVPVIRDADRLGLTDLALAIADLATRARTKKLRPEEVRDGTFTLNNTGANGSVLSRPILNEPQTGILTTEAVVKRPVVVEGDAIAVRDMMNLCLTFDHRVIDGGAAGDFMNDMKARLERWSPADIRL